MTPVSVIILTLNEECHLDRAVNHLRNWAAGVFVVDSESDDETVRLAQNHGCHVSSRAFTNYADQREWALRNLPFKTEWVLFLDADEILSEELKQEISRVIESTDTTEDGFYLHRRFYWMDRWLKHGGLHPIWILRLVRHARARCNPRPINEHLEVDGQTGRLEAPLHHVDLKSISHWQSKHNRYATLEARELLKAARSQDGDSLAKFWGTQVERKRWVRQRIWNPIVPGFLRPLASFGYSYFLRLGFLDGIPGLTYHLLHGFCYRALIEVKYHSLRKSGTEKINPGPVLH